MAISSKIGGENADDLAARARNRQPINEEAARALEARRAADLDRGDDDGGASRRVMPNRVPFGQHAQTLAVPQRPGYFRHWFNDSPARIARAKAAGYEHVLENGEPMSRNVGRDGLKAYLMETPIEWRNEDKAAAEAAETEKIRAIKAGNTLKSGQYVGKQGIRIDEGR